jgi:hypothetical protein
VSNIEGVPEGWELVRVGVVHHGEWRLMDDGSIRQWLTIGPSTGWAVVLRKIEKPATYRPFANAAEFKPHRDRWLTRKDKSDPTHLDGACRVVAYCDNHLWWADGRNSTYKEELDHGRCFDDDGTPFGVKIDE